MSDVVLAIAGELRLDVVLDRLVHAARELGGARYAALGIPDAGRDGFDQFLHAGMSDDLVAELGPLPRTHGLLGAMLVDPSPFRSSRHHPGPALPWLVAGRRTRSCARSSASRSWPRATSSARCT